MVTTAVVVAVDTDLRLQNAVFQTLGLLIFLSL